MNARYRIVHFVPDPFLGTRLPIAALVEDRGRLHVANVPNLPGPQCLGGVGAWALVQTILADLHEAWAFDRPPECLGPQAVFGEERRVPGGVENARTWVERLLASHVHRQLPPDAPEHPHRPQRSTLGYRFFQNYKVEKFVRKTFKPGVDAGRFLRGAAALGAISHFVEGASEVLLMEPIAPRRPQWEDDVQRVAQMFGAYKTARLHERGPRKAALTAYVLEGGSADARTSIIRDLTPFVDDVVDTASAGMRGRFIEHIKATGRSRNPELPM